MHQQSPLPSPPLSPTEHRSFNSSRESTHDTPVRRKRTRESSETDTHSSLRVKNARATIGNDLCQAAQYPCPDQHILFNMSTAVQYRQVENVERLLPITTVTRSLLEETIISGSAPILRLLLQKYDSQDDADDLIQQAVFWNRIECLCVLIEVGYSVNPPSKTPLYTAVQQRKIDIVKLLRKFGADPCESNGHNPSLLYAASHGFVAMIPLLITPKTSKRCVRQALFAAAPLGLQVCQAILRAITSAAVPPTTSSIQ